MDLWNPTVKGEVAVGLAEVRFDARDVLGEPFALLERDELVVRAMPELDRDPDVLERIAPRSNSSTPSSHQPSSPGASPIFIVFAKNWASSSVATAMSSGDKSEANDKATSSGVIWSASCRSFLDFSLAAVRSEK